LQIRNPRGGKEECTEVSKRRSVIYSTRYKGIRKDRRLQENGKEEARERLRKNLMCEVWKGGGGGVKLVKRDE